MRIGPRLTALIARREIGLAVVITVLFVVTGVAFPQFATLANAGDMLDDTAILMLLAVGQFMVLLTRGVDLSVAANAALAGMAATLVNREFPELGMAAVLATALIVGAVLGALNGLLVWRLKIPPIVATLGTMAVYRGLTYFATHGEWISSSQMSPAFLGFVRLQFLGLSIVTWAAIGAAVAGAFFLHYARLGRSMFAAGDNPDAAIYAGVDVGRSQFWAFTLCGILAGLGGYFWVSRFGVAYVDTALGFELQVIAACVIGGVAITGGAGSVTGVILGALFLGFLKNAMPLVGVSPFWQMAISGLVIVLAAALSARAAKGAPRRILESAAP